VKKKKQQNAFLLHIYCDNLLTKKRTENVSLNNYFSVSNSSIFEAVSIFAYFFEFPLPHKKVSKLVPSINKNYQNT
jgi:hypothetical protein